MDIAGEANKMNLDGSVQVSYSDTGNTLTTDSLVWNVPSSGNGTGENIIKGYLANTTINVLPPIEEEGYSLVTGSFDFANDIQSQIINISIAQWTKSNH